MSKYNNVDRLIAAWAEGQARGESCGNVRTEFVDYEGEQPSYCDLYSYRQVIARRFFPTTRGSETVPACFAVVTDKWSVTTSKHTTKAYGYAARFCGYNGDQRIIRLPQFAILRARTMADALVLQDMGMESGAIK